MKTTVGALRRRLTGYVFLGAVAPVLTGCGAEFNSIYRSQNLKSGNTIISQDAKQRVITVSEQPHAHYQVTCVEPSPDAFSVYAASAAGNGSLPNGLVLGGSGASSEAGASLALRTQSIQLLRDQSYRICESYANGATTEVDYTQLIRRNQVMLTAILAIEQLTGAVTGPSSAIGASATNSVDQAALQKAQGDLSDAQAKLKDLAGTATKADADAKDKQVKLKKIMDEPATAADHDKNLKQAQTDANDAATAATKARTDEKTQQGIVDKDRQIVSNVSLPNIKTDTTGSQTGSHVSSAVVGDVSGAVVSIIDVAFGKTFMLDLCQQYWSGGIKDVKEPSKIGAKCDAFFDDYLKTIQVERDILVKTGGSVSRRASPSITVLERGEGL